LRIVIVGDFHMKEDDLEVTRKAMEDIAHCNADLVVPLGDFGSNEKIGRVEGLAQSYEFLSGIKALLRPILGNHDLERESGRAKVEQGLIQQAFIRLYGLDKPYGVLEYDTYRFMFISTDPQPEDSCYQIQECYVSEEQYDWFLNALAERPGIPVIMFTHAPPIGCGLRTVPEVHVRAANAYLDQNHDAYRWLRLFQSHAEIVMWFSAHYHLSHMYEDSQTNPYGTSFFTTGVHGRATRDQKRQSRVFDIENDKIVVSTLDHDQRRILDEPIWRFDGSVEHLVNIKTKRLQSFKENVRAESEAKEQRSDVRPSISCNIGKQSILPLGMIPFKKDHFLVATAEGYLWELDAGANAVLGTYHIGEPLSCFTCSDGTVWRAWDTYLATGISTTPGRFIHERPKGLPTGVIHMPFAIKTMASRAEGGVWISSINAVFALKPDFNQAAANLLTTPVLTLHEDIIQMKSVGSKLWLYTVKGNLYEWDGVKADAEIILENVLSWDGDGSQIIALLSDYYITILDVDNAYNISDAIDISSFKSIGESALHSNPLLHLGDRKFIFIVAGKALIWDETEWIEIDTMGKSVTSAVRNFDHTGFCLGTDPIEAMDLPQLQMWKLE